MRPARLSRGFLAASMVGTYRHPRDSLPSGQGTAVHASEYNGNSHAMTKSNDETHTSHAPGSQPSVRPDSDEPQTITAPTPPVAWNSDSPDPADLAAEDDDSGRPGTDEEPKATPHGE